MVNMGMRQKHRVGSVFQKAKSRRRVVFVQLCACVHQNPCPAGRFHALIGHFHGTGANAVRAAKKSEVRGALLAFRTAHRLFFRRDSLGLDFNRRLAAGPELHEIPVNGIGLIGFALHQAEPLGHEAIPLIVIAFALDASHIPEGLDLVLNAGEIVCHLFEKRRV